MSRAVVARRRSTLDPLFVVGSHTGARGIPWAVLLVVLHRTAPGGEKLDLRRGVGCVLGTWSLAHLAKRTNHRRRPCQDGDAPPLVRCPHSASLPSDEAACAFAGAAFASVALPRLAPLLYMLSAWTAISRVYVGAHYPTDVAAGALIGTAIGRLTATR